MFVQKLWERSVGGVCVALCATISMAAAGLPVSQGAAPGAVVLTAPQRLATAALPHSSTVALSADGRFLAFESDAALLPADTNGCGDVYVLDLRTRDLTLASETWDGSSGNGSSGHPGLSGDGRFVVFSSDATNLLKTPGVLQGSDVYLRDRERKETRRISTAIGGGAADAMSASPAISADASTITFESSATNLTSVADANKDVIDVYAFHPGTGQIERVSVGTNGLQGNAGSFGAVVSSDGRMIAFTSRADLGCPRARSKSIAGPSAANVYARDMRARLTQCVSASHDGSAADGASYHASIDASGRWVAFASEAANFGIRDGNGASDIYLRDLEAGTIVLVSRTSRGKSANGRSWRPAITGDGSMVAFTTTASNLEQAAACHTAAPDANLVSDVYAFDVATRVTRRLSTGGCDDVWWEASQGPATDARGDVVAFSSRHPSAPGDTGHDNDAFVVRLGGGRQEQIGFCDSHTQEQTGEREKERMGLLALGGGCR